ncbi:MAG: tetratricopeptide repeat protein [Desulfohalobiaceae bacterium]|nr:tetratricopeptide repeat protein [Desulfohalobiaceae bacterium]
MKKRTENSIRYISVLLLLVAIVSGCSGLQVRESARQKEVRARMDLSKSHLRNGQPRRGLQELLRIKDRARNIPEFHFLMGLTRMQLREQESAAEHFKQAVDLNPEYGEAWNNLGQVLVSLDRFDEAEQAFQRALAIPTYLTPEYPAYNLARLEEKRGRTDHVLKYAALSLEENERYSPAYILLADVWLEKGNIQKAIEWLEEGLKVVPNNIALMLPLAENHLRLGQKSHAKQWFARILEIDPDSEEAQVARDYLDILP